MELTLEEANSPIVPPLDIYQQNYAGGLSRHGKRYVLDANIRIYNNASAQCEVIFELYRRAHYPEKPSRFLSMFGCETIKEAAYFRGQSQCGIDTPIFKVHTESTYHRADMNLLSTNCSLFDMDFRAELYWSGITAEMHDGYKPFWEVIIPLPVTIGEQVQE